MLNCYDINNISFDLLDENIMLVVNKLAPLKFKYIRVNQGAFMKKDLRKAIMQRSKFRNIFYRVKTEETRIAYNKQRNFCTNLVIKTEISYFNSLNPSLVSDNKIFWKTIKPLVIKFAYEIVSQSLMTIVSYQMMPKLLRRLIISILTQIFFLMLIR